MVSTWPGSSWSPATRSAWTSTPRLWRRAAPGWSSWRSSAPHALRRETSDGLAELPLAGAELTIDPASGLAWVAGHLASTATLPDGLSLVSGSGTVSTDDDVVSLDRVDTALGESNDDQRRLSTGEVRVNHGLVNPCVGVSGELESGRPSPDTIDRVIGRPSSSGVSIGTRTISGIPCTTWWNGAWQSIAVAAELDFRILPSQAGRQVAKAGAFSGPRLIGRRHAIDDEAWDLASEDRLRNRLIVNFATRDSVDAHSQPTEGIHSG